ncbi:hypothetical protein VB796_14170 [Arcicella sp. LKC2W]|uniref:hypothetical protein n=1 Tax=Arcicella sp. LKC2W TaxID=2984198 RepID=UPI002B20FB0F|nr:hypothetical protein [Arcicella sp. LKC2W]MEA5460199.1 hypothetical protein [Arcicella sp. LKC2W]
MIVDDCQACEPVNRLVNELLEKGFVIIEQRMEDYHFHQLYIKLQGNIDLLNLCRIDGFSSVENKFICECHWSTIEFITSRSDVYFC